MTSNAGLPRDERHKPVRAPAGLVVAVAALPVLSHVVLASGHAPHPASWALKLVAAASHTAINGSLLLLFARSLRPGRVDLVTALSTRLRGPPPPARARYARQVAWAWVAYFAIQLATSASLAAFAPLAWWSLFVNVLDLPLALLMFGAEQAWRHRRFPDDPPVSAAAIFAAFRSPTP